jgi:hypothetical protein
MCYSTIASGRFTMPARELAEAVTTFTRALLRRNGVELGQEHLIAPVPGERWNAYGHSPRAVVFQVYQELRELAIDVAILRSTTAPQTVAQQILAQHHFAYRDLTGALSGVQDNELDRIPAEGEWPLRDVIEHLFGAERGFLMQIEWAVERWEAREPVPTEIPREQALARFGEIDVTGGLPQILARYEWLHDQVVAYCAGLTDEQLAAPSLWWEGYSLPVRFRLQRFDAHLREHTIQVDKTLVGIGHVAAETERLSRLLHLALGACEGVLIGAEDVSIEQLDVLPAQIMARTGLLVAGN